MVQVPRLKGTNLRAAIIGVCGICFCLLGYDQGVLGSLIGLPRFLNAIGSPDATIQGVVTSIYSIGCMVSCLFVS